MMVPDLSRAYRSWTGKRLALPLAAALAALAAAVAFVLFDRRPPAVRLPYAVIALLLAALEGYLVLRTWSVTRDRRRLPLQVVRTRRRETRPAALISVVSLLVLLGLAGVPAPAPDAWDPIEGAPVLRRTRRRAAEPAAPTPAPAEPE